MYLRPRAVCPRPIPEIFLIPDTTLHESGELCLKRSPLKLVVPFEERIESQ